MHEMRIKTSFILDMVLAAKSVIYLKLDEICLTKHHLQRNNGSAACEARAFAREHLYNISQYREASEISMIHMALQYRILLILNCIM